MRKYIIGLLFLITVIVAGSTSAAKASALSLGTFSTSPMWCGMAAAIGYDTSGTDCATIFNHSTTHAQDTQASSGASSSTSTNTTKAYVALGDSVAAGDGLPLASNATNEDAACARSPEAYSNLVAAKLHMSLRNVSCSGATVGDLLTKQDVGDTDIPAQLNAAFANGTPNLITITAGANDVNWINFIKACYAFDCTRSGYSSIASGYQAVLKVKLATALADIYYKSNGQPPKVIVTGYYEPLSSACTAQQQAITPEEITWLTSETTKLNQAIQDVTNTYTFAQFVPLDFRGHDMCSSKPWVQGLNDPAPLHPTATGQRVIANAIIAALH